MQPEPERMDLPKFRTALEQERARTSTDSEPTFLTFRHPGNLFSIDVPAHWTVNQGADGAVEFSHPSESEYVGLMIFKSPLLVDTQSIKESGKWEAIAHAMFEQVESSHVRRDPTIIYDNFMADRPEPEQGGKRWFVLVADVILGISSAVLVSSEETWQPVFERMLSSLRVDRDDELLTLRVMNRIQAKLAESIPDAKIEVRDSLLVTDRLEISIDNLLPQVKRNPSELEQVVDHFVAGIVGMSQSQQVLGQEAWDDVSDRILPLLKPDKYVQAVNQKMSEPKPDREHEPALLISLPWLADLRVCFAIDDDKTFRYVSNVDIHRWNVSLEQPARVAVDNLTNLPLPTLMSAATGEDFPKLAALEPKAGAAASYMLHPLLYRLASQELGREIFAAIPSRDALMLFEDRGQQEQVQRAVQLDFRQTNHPVSDRLFRVTPDGIALL